MKTYALFFIGLILLAVAGCSTPEQIVEQKVSEKITDTKDAVKGAVVDKAVETVDKKSQDLVNMKCVETNGGITTTYYLLKGDIRTDTVSPAEGVSRQTWLLNTTAYSKMKVGETEYLVTMPVEESQVTYRSAEVAYQTFNAAPNIECEKGIVKESDFVLPDLEHIDNQQLSDKMMELFAAQGLPTQ
ncbi:MAG: hypothetical protein AABY09_00205 [Nanoarchaeota archaeon]